jgi:hypothetical protein
LENKRGCVGMPGVEFPYVEQESRIFGKVKRPLVSIDILSFLSGDWTSVDEVLADTGADITIGEKVKFTWED